MIIEALMSMVYTLFENLFSSIDIPSLTSSDIGRFNEYVDLIVDFGVNLVNVFIPFDFCQFLIGVVIGIEIVIDLYQVVLWVYRKIPFLGGS